MTSFEPACRSDPDLWFSAPDRPEAMHICLTHCPVLEPCRLAAQRYPPIEGVQAGVVFTKEGVPFPHRQYTAARTCGRCPTRQGPFPPSDLDSCGTYRGYRWHLRHGEKACEACRQAGAEARRRERSGAVQEEKE